MLTSYRVLVLGGLLVGVVAYAAYDWIWLTGLSSDEPPMAVASAKKPLSLIGGPETLGVNPLPSSRSDVEAFKPRTRVSNRLHPKTPVPQDRASVVIPQIAKRLPVPRVMLARDALAFVGMDPDANSYWCDVINDPNVDAETRKDLIEDLNEEGFPDPKNLTPDDLPLITSRIELIEELAPLTIDDTNLAAFAEAYKDLLNRHDRLVPP